MATLSRTASLESTGSGPKNFDLTTSASPAASDITRSERSLASTGRVHSHSLLSTSPTSSVPSRKSRFADAGTVGGNVGRASLSMPPPGAKPTSIYKPSNARHPHTISNTQEGKEAILEIEGPRDEPSVIDSAAKEELHKTTSSTGSHTSGIEVQSTSDISEGNLKPRNASLNKPGDRLSFSSLYSLGSAMYNGPAGPPSASQSAASSNAGSIKSGVSEQPFPASMPLSPSLGSLKTDAVSAATTATDPVLVTANSGTLHQIHMQTAKDLAAPNSSAASRHLDSWGSRPNAPRRSRSKHTRTTTASNTTSSAVSPSNSDRIKAVSIGRVGVCALDVKARSKASRNILTRLSSSDDFDVVIFGDKVILDEDVENWPKCDFLLSFFSDGFPLDKAIAYNNLRKPFVVNDLPMQKILWDRRICLRILDSVGVPTPQRIEVNRDGGPRLESPRLAEHLFKFSGVKLEGPEDGTGGGIRKTEVVSLADDGDSIFVDGVTLRKPFVEKPISGEDHNIHIYFPKSHHGGGGRRLFRKIGNKSSEWDKDLKVPRAVTEEGSSYLYERFLHVDNAEDIKAYTVGPEYCHAETRTSPVVDGLVRRNTHGKEIRYICKLTPEEQMIAKKIANGFGQRVCGFDMLRVKGQSFVIDVNGWSFVKDNNDYYDKCAQILKEMFTLEKRKQDGTATPTEAPADKDPEKTQPEKNHVDPGGSYRKPTTSNHRSEFVKKLMKSPSMSKLRNHHAAEANTRANPSLKAAVATTPLPSPPTFESEQQSALAPGLPVSDRKQLPATSLSTDQEVAGIPNPSPTTESPLITAPEPASKHSWKLKGMVSVIRHADRTPKQKYKFTLHTQPFVDLLKGHQEEVLLKGESALNSVLDASKIALEQGIEDPEKLNLLRTSLTRKGAWTGTKVQIKPMFRKRRAEEIKKIKSEMEKTIGSEGLIAAQQLTEDPEEQQSPLSNSHTRSDSIAGTTLSRFSAAENDLILDKLQLIVKWGGEPTHSARYQSQDLGENMRADLLLMNKEALDNVRVFTSSEKRVTTSGKCQSLKTKIIC